jgi:hypothetical protein
LDIVGSESGGGEIDREGQRQRVKEREREKEREGQRQRERERETDREREKHGKQPGLSVGGAPLGRVIFHCGLPIGCPPAEPLIPL